MRDTVDLKNPFRSELPPNGTLVTSPVGLRGHIAGNAPSPGRILVVFQVAGKNKVVEMWPTDLRGYVLPDGRRL